MIDKNESAPPLTTDQLSALLGSTIMHSENPSICYYCSRTLEDGECVFCVHTSAVRNGIKALFPFDQIVEVRALRVDGGRAMSGLFTDHAAMAEAVSDLSADPAYRSIYYTLNPIRQEWLDSGKMSVNCLRNNPATTKDSDITSRSWLLLDFDPVRPANTSSTNGELTRAEDLMHTVANHLNDLGWAPPLIASSGNGHHLLYRLALPATHETDTLIEFALKALSQKFSTDDVTVDTVVGNRARICKAYGTVTRKGVQDGSRPWRESRISNFRLVSSPVTLDQIKAVATTYTRFVEPSKLSEAPCLDPDFDVDDLIEHFELDILGHETKDDGNSYYYLSSCPFVGRAHHGDVRKTALVVGNNLGFSCFSDECADNHIGDFLRLLSEEYGRFPAPIWPDTTIPDGWGEDDETLPEPVAPALELTVEHAPDTSNAAAADYTDGWRAEDRTPETKTKRMYETPVNEDDCRYPFPQEALFGWLGQKTLELDAPLGWAYPAMLTVWAGQGIDLVNERGYPQKHPSPPPTLFTVLLSAPGAGKSVTMNRAMRTIPARDRSLRKDTVPSSDRGILTLFKPGKDEPTPDPDDPRTFLLFQDEFKSCLSKIAISGSSLASTFCSLYYLPTAGVADKTGSHEISAWLNILGGLPAADEAEFSEYFGSETTAGLYSRFIYGVGPKHWSWNHRWEPKPENRYPSKVYVGDLPHDVTEAWVAEGHALGKSERGRLAEKALRIAVISASANGDTEVSAECMAAAMAFARWQESIVDTHKAGVSETIDGKIQSAIEDTLDGLRVDGVSNWVKFWDLARRKNWSKKWGSSTVTRVKKAMIDDKTLLEEFTEPDEEGKGAKKFKATGYIRLRNKAGVEIEHSDVYKKAMERKAR